MVFCRKEMQFWVISAIVLALGSVKATSISQLENLNVNMVAQQFKAHKTNGNGKALLMFDIDGTLTHRKSLQKNYIKEYSRRALNTLANSPLFDVYLNTGKSEEGLQAEWDIPKVGWIYNHGAYMREPDRSGTFSLMEPGHGDWLQETKTKVAEKWGTDWPRNGVKMNSGTAMINWIGQSGQEFDQFYNELKELLSDTSVVTFNEGTLIEVTRKGINKGTGVQHVMKDKSYALALAAGDDVRDDEMFRQIREHGPKENTYAVIINTDGDRETSANYKLDHFHKVLRFFEQITGESLNLGQHEKQ